MVVAIAGPIDDKPKSFFVFDVLEFQPLSINGYVGCSCKSLLACFK